MTHDLLAVPVGDLLALPHTAQHGVEPEVNEHAELVILPLLDRFSAGSDARWLLWLIQRLSVGKEGSR